MGVIILVLVIGTPLLEIALFVEVGERIGATATLMLVLLSAAVGMALLRFQGFTTLRRAQISLDEGRLPVAEVLDGLGLLLASGLLVVPGFATDAIGLLLFIPAIRRMLGRWIRRYLVATGKVRVDVAATMDARRAPSGGGPVIDGQYEDVTDDDKSSPKLPPAGPDGR